MPVTLDFNETDPTDRHRDTAPPSRGTIIRVVDIPPEGQNGPNFDRDMAEALFETVGLGENAKHTIPGRHPLMHRTESLDYGIVLSGEIVLLLDDEDVPLGPGDVVVQRGTIHAWANRSDDICRMAFVLTDGKFSPHLEETLASRDAEVQARAGSL